MSSPHESRIYYSLSEANEQIPRLEILFSELARIQRKVNELSRVAEKYGIQLDPDALLSPVTEKRSTRRHLHEEARGLTVQYSEVLAEIESLGVVVDDLDMGLINFYSLCEGGEILLSWQYGESAISHWRSMADLAAPRKPLWELHVERGMQESLH